MSYNTLELCADGDGVLCITLCRPAARNAINREMVRELESALSEAANNSDVLAIVITGAGETFASGADIAELRERRRSDAWQRINSHLFRLVELQPQPTIAAVRGYALGGGCELALACDLRIAGESAIFGQPEVSLGIIPGAGATYRLPRVVGQAWARELIFTGRRIDALTAHRIGLVNRVVPDEDVIAESMSLGRTIAAQSPLAVRLAKQCLNAAAGRGDSALMALEATTQAVLFEDDDKERRMTAFLERKQNR